MERCCTARADVAVRVERSRPSSTGRGGSAARSVDAGDWGPAGFIDPHTHRRACVWDHGSPSNRTDSPRRDGLWLRIAPSPTGCTEYFLRCSTRRGDPVQLPILVSPPGRREILRFGHAQPFAVNVPASCPIRLRFSHGDRARGSARPRPIAQDVRRLRQRSRWAPSDSPVACPIVAGYGDRYRPFRRRRIVAGVVEACAWHGGQRRGQFGGTRRAHPRSRVTPNGVRAGARLTGPVPRRVSPAAVALRVVAHPSLTPVLHRRPAISALPFACC